MEKRSTRRVCPFCHEELSLTAFYRHSNDTQGVVCPGKQRASQLPLDTSSPCNHETYPSSSESSFDPMTEDVRDLESSFYFSDCESADQAGVVDSELLSSGESVDSDALHVEEMLEERLSSDDECSLGEEEEIWEDYSDDSDQETSPRNVRARSIVIGVCLFLNFFQLFYRVSERAVLSLLSFLRFLFTFLASNAPSQLYLKEVSTLLPRSLCSIRRVLREDANGVVEYVVCPKCNALYMIKDCIVRQYGREESRLCDFMEYPRHPYPSMRTKCNTVLLKKINVGNKNKLVPRKTFVYNSLISGLTKLVCTKGFLQKCEHWRKRQSIIPSGTYADVYEGHVWKELGSISSRPFLSHPNNLCLMLNIDWFNPYEETPYSAGVIYFVVQNLPRSERFKFENVILVGMIPGPNEPKKHINTYLAPIVKDLQHLYAGVTVSNPNSYCGTTLFRAILSCVSCDLPATRKVCGFYSFCALRGCSKCLKEFVTTSFGSKPDYSGFNVNSWGKRNLATHTAKAFAAKEAATASAQVKIEQSYGVRYSVLLTLPYFDVIRYHVVDPMHSLFLGIAKHTVKVWRDIGIIRAEHLITIQEKVNNMTPPPKVGRIPRKIQSGFTAFTADEWKNWITLYSPYILYGILPNADFECWCYFVEACQLLCQPIINTYQIVKSHDLLVRFCTTYEQLYGKERCTPNMHMSCHLKDIMLDYGPVHGFWCFSFERYNGVLEAMQKSWINPEKQLMQKFLDLQIVSSIDVSPSAATSSDFATLVRAEITALRNTQKASGSVCQMSYESVDIIQQLHSLSGSTSYIDPQEKPFHRVIQPLYEKCFTDEELGYLSNVYKAIYPHIVLLHISRFHKEFKTLVINGDEYISVKSRSQRSAAVIAHWPSLTGTIDTMGEAPCRIGNVQSFIRHQITFDGVGSSSSMVTMLARIKWFENHPRRDHFYRSVIVCGTMFCAESSSTFIPVSRIMGRCTTLKTRYHFDYGQDCIMIAIPSIPTSV